ncbi:368_t:CDS:1, partial [Funneliformis caledonium]
MSSSLQDVSLAKWQWQDPLTRFFLITIIFIWGYVLELCGEQPDYNPELQYLMSFGSFIVALIVGILAQATLAHMFAYIQGYFLLRRHGIPLEAIMSGEQTPLRVLSACLVIFKQNDVSTKGYKKRKYTKYFQIALYSSTLFVYIASVGAGAYASSKLGTPYVYITTPIKWAQTPTVGKQDSLNNAFISRNFIGAMNMIQFNSLAKWVDKTRGDKREIAFLPVTFTTLKDALVNANLGDTNGIKWRVEMELDNINMQYLAAQ